MTTMRRGFSSCSLLHGVRPYILADIGEGITECQINAWFVKPGDHVQQFDPICEVQSDKASVEVTSRYEGVIKALRYAQDAIAAVGEPLLDIDVVDEDETAPEVTDTPIDPLTPQKPDQSAEGIMRGSVENPENTTVNESAKDAKVDRARDSAPIMPALRHLLKQNGLDAADVVGTGKNGRITKEDVQGILQSRSTNRENAKKGEAVDPSSKPNKGSASVTPVLEEDTVTSLSRVGLAMFQSMTQALSIPHFMYSHEVDIAALNRVRSNYNKPANTTTPVSKLSPLPFILKAVSQAFLENPRLNAHLDTSTNQPQIITRSSHNFGIAVDSPNGLVVPVIKDVQKHSVSSLAYEIKRVGLLAEEGRLSPEDFKGATFTVSNIGSIGGTVVAPVIVPPMVGIVAIGKATQVPVFRADEEGVERIVKREQLCLSWSADHRVLDGATVARIAEHTRRLVENVDAWSVRLK